MTTDILAERIDGGCDLLASVAPHAKSGDLRVLAIAAPKRSPVLPDAPTSTEEGLPDFQTETWTGLFLPKDTADDIAKRLEDALMVVLKDASVIERLDAIGATIPASEQQGSAYMQELVLKEIETWTAVLKDDPSAQ